MHHNSTIDDILTGKVTAHEVALRGCLHPSVIRSFDADLSIERDIPVSCGTCPRCLDQYREEWVSRMLLHSLSYKWCYFITLTYGSYNLHTFKKHPFKYSWLETYPVLDSHNTSGRPAWTPSLLLHPHLSAFFKRLRKQINCELSYCACGEYGSTARDITDPDSFGYGRPHFHAIIFTDAYLTKADIIDAWSYDCCKTKDPSIVNKWVGSYSSKKSSFFKFYDASTDRYYSQDPKLRFQFNIGSPCAIGFENLNYSGAMDWNGVSQSVSGFNNAPSCFSYVCKYIGKQKEIPNNALRRIDSCYKHIPCRGYFPTDCTEYSISPVDRRVLALDPYIDLRRDIHINGRDYSNIDKYDFRKIVSPFFVSSRINAIGKKYLLQNIDRISGGSLDLPPFQGKNLCFPRYFSRLVSNATYPVRIREKTPLSRSLVKGSLPTLREYFYGLATSRDYYYYVKNRLASLQLDEDKVPSYRGAIVSASPRRSPYQDRIKPSARGFLYDITMIYPDLGNVHFDYSPQYDAFIGYTYNKHKKCFDPCDYYERADFCEIILDFIDSRLARVPSKLQRSEDALKLLTLIASDPAILSTVKDYEHRRIDMQNNYHVRKVRSSDSQ